ncbi:Homeobox protein Nkx-6.3 [Acropora cervicornis]|uniref:Homeobox protein Nkx-6.3 n=1 Tax=Acropora cervicornis TaxID=6130 RepID=A0AAD9Q3G3_ACRCE|nr:Homeobox protein Nkx-6.3 [Acropora cervicornis]
MCAMGTRVIPVCVLDKSPVKRSPSGTHFPLSSTAVSGQRLSFSISKILGLESDSSPRQSSPNSVPTRPSKCSPKSSNFALDLTSSSSECDSEPDQVPTDSEKTSKKRRQRTTFSAHEVWAMERAFKQCPYLLRDDEMHLVYRLGIPAKSVRYWFQNRRAKSRREKSHQAQAVTKRPVTFSHSVQFLRHTAAVSDVADIRIERVWSKAGTDPRGQPRFQPRVVEDYCPREPYLNDQLRSKLQMEYGLPMFHPDQLKNRIQADLTKTRYSRSSKRPKPY